jgi:hypothetical protein
LTTYNRPYLYPKQREAFFNDARYSLIEASTKAGKTVAAIAWILERAFAGSHGQNFWWVAPVSDQAKIAFTRIKNGLTRGSFVSAESPTPRVTLMNGVVIWFKSGDNPDSLYGEDVFAAVVDEASRVREESWHALRSTLTATQGHVRIIGNVKGRKNWFYRLARMAESEGMAVNMYYAKITVLDAIAAGVIPQSEVEDAKRTLPEHVFRELYMAEPSDDGGNPFGLDHIRSCVGDLSRKPPRAFGIDLAKKQDYLVVIGLDEDGAVCVFRRWTHKPWRESIREIHQIVGEDVPALVDSTGIGDPVLEDLQHGHGNFEGYHFTATSKQKLMEGLAVSIQGHEISYPEGRIPIELEAFEYELTRTGVRYAIAEDAVDNHDDCVCALALARQRWAETAPGESIMQFYSSEAQRQRAAAALVNEEEKPWLRESLVVAIDTLDNELEELYNSSVRAATPDLRPRCYHCGEPVVGHRVSDGVLYWHPEHAGGLPRIAA